jgi:hypothetical protein
MKFLVYGLQEADSTLPFYIGWSGDDKRSRPLTHIREAHNSPTHRTNRHKCNTILAAEKRSVEILVIEFLRTDSFEDSVQTEKDLIHKYGRRDLGTGCLTNMTDGGDGYRGWSEAARAETSKRFKGKTYEELYGIEKAKELREQKSKFFKGVPKPKSQREKIGIANRKRRGYPAWNKGLSKDTDSRVASVGRAVSKALKGRTYEEMFGLKEAKRRKEKVSKTLTGRKRGPYKKH